MAFQTYTVGRSSQADIRIEHGSVSRIHLELTVADDKKYFVIDCQSTHGTFLKSGGNWQSFKQGYVTASDKLRLGKVIVDLSEILAQLVRDRVSSNS